MLAISLEKYLYSVMFHNQAIRMHVINTITLPWTDPVESGKCRNISTELMHQKRYDHAVKVSGKRFPRRVYVGVRIDPNQRHIRLRLRMAEYTSDREAMIATNR